MTNTSNRRTIRETTALVRNRGKLKAVVVCLTGDRIEMRLKGERKRYSLTASMAYTLAVQSHVLAEKARRKADRAMKRKR